MADDPKEPTKTLLGWLPEPRAPHTPQEPTASDQQQSQPYASEHDHSGQLKSRSHSQSSPSYRQPASDSQATWQSARHPRASNRPPGSQDRGDEQREPSYRQGH